MSLNFDEAKRIAGAQFRTELGDELDEELQQRTGLSGSRDGDGWSMTLDFPGSAPVDSLTLGIVRLDGHGNVLEISLDREVLRQVRIRMGQQSFGEVPKTINCAPQIPRSDESEARPDPAYLNLLGGT